MKKILFIGGGSGGHILPMMNLMEECIKRGNEASLVVADQGLDRKIADENFGNLGLNDVYFLKTGKIRRYFSWQNFVDFLRIFKAIFQARGILKKEKPDVIFFKGGFVCFPILVAARFLFPRNKAKMFLHNSDISSGALSGLIGKYCDRVFSNFGEEPLRLFYQGGQVEKTYPNGEGKTSESSLRDSDEALSPLRETLAGRESGLSQILIFAGSQGAQFINEIIIENADVICEKYFVTLITGVGKRVDFNHENFEQFEMLSVDDLDARIRKSDLVISRAGASVFQVIAAKKPSIVIPLPSSARNHQALNAEYLEGRNLVRVLVQDGGSSGKLVGEIGDVMSDEIMRVALAGSDVGSDYVRICGVVMG